MQQLIVYEHSDYDVIILVQREHGDKYGSFNPYDHYVGVFTDMESLRSTFNEKIKDKKTAQGIFYAYPVKFNTISTIYAE